MAKLSGVYRYEKKLFRYDYENCVVQWVSPLTAEMKADNEEWQRKYGEDLWEVEEGMVVNDSIGLRPENWKNKDMRNEYLDEWVGMIAEEVEFEIAMEGLL